jgi:hypothetical protein
MLPFEDRFTRQRQLREVGLAGQRRIEASSVVVGPSAADGVAADYLQRAGVQVTVTRDVHFVDSTSARALDARRLCAFEGPADYLAGALAALVHVRSVLNLGDSVSSTGVGSAKS